MSSSESERDPRARRLARASRHTLVAVSASRKRVGEGSVYFVNVRFDSMYTLSMDMLSVTAVVRISV